jgi:integrase
MQAAVMARARAAGVALTLHDFRRTLISDLLDEGVDLATVAKIVGHRDPKTTARYDRRPERARIVAIERHGELETPQREG